jgi:hypothetical protein
MRQIQTDEIKNKSRGKELHRSSGRVGVIYGGLSYLTILLPLFAILVLAQVYPVLNRRQIPDWRRQIAAAEEFLEQGDHDQARHFYLQAGRMATWQNDWAGLVAAACGFKRLDGAVNPYSKAFSMLIRAAAAAELIQSRRGVAIVAKAFAMMGADRAAAAVLAGVQPSWPDETNDVGSNRLLEACRTAGKKPNN